jgi:hypothetical protein
MNQQLVPMGELRLSFSGAQSWLSCRQRWYFSYKENIRRKEVSYPLQVGKVLHELVHQYYMGELTGEVLEHLDEYVIGQYPDQPHALSVEVAVEAGTLLQGYLLKFDDDPLTVISSEMKIESHREEPQTQWPYKIYGIIDAVCRTKDQRLWRLEHKTAAKMDTFYLKGLRSGLQGGIYHYLLNKTMPEPIVGTIYNMFVKTKVPQYERMPVMMQEQLAQRALSTFDGVARQIYRGDVFMDAGSCFSYNRECDYLPLCNQWKGEWDEITNRIKGSFFQARQSREEEEKKGKEAETQQA